MPWPANRRPGDRDPVGGRARRALHQYASSYPYAADGRIPAPSGSGLLDPMVTLSYLAARTRTVRLGTAMLLLAPAQSRLHGQGSLLPRLALGWPGRPGHRRGLAERGVRRARRARGSGAGRGPTSTSKCCARCGATTPRRTAERSTHCPPARCSPSRSSSRTLPCTSVARPTPPCAGRPGSARAGTPSTAPPKNWRTG